MGESSEMPESPKGFFSRIFSGKRNSPSEIQTIKPAEVAEPSKEISGVSTYEKVETRDPSAIISECLEKSVGWGIQSKFGEGHIFRGKTLPETGYRYIQDGDLSFLDLGGDYGRLPGGHLVFGEIVKSSELISHPRTCIAFENQDDGFCKVGIYLKHECLDLQQRPIAPLGLYAKMPTSLAVELYQLAKSDPSSIKELINKGVGGLFESKGGSNPANERIYTPVYGESLVALDMNALIPEASLTRDERGVVKGNWPQESNPIFTAIRNDRGVAWEKHFDT